MAQLKAVWWVLGECGVQALPSLGSVLAVKAKIRLFPVKEVRTALARWTNRH